MFSAPQKLKFKKFHKLKFNTRRTENRFFVRNLGITACRLSDLEK